MQSKFRLPDSEEAPYSSFLLVNEFASIASITYEVDIRHFNAAFTEIREFPDILLSMVSGWLQPTASASSPGLVSVDDGFGGVADGRKWRLRSSHSLRIGKCRCEALHLQGDELDQTLDDLTAQGAVST